MPAQKRSNDSAYEDDEDDDVELEHNNQNVSDESEDDDVEQEEQESDDDESPSSSCSDEDEFVYVKLADVRKDVQCPICLGIIRKTRKVMECLHRFCRECIDKSMRMGNNECPACRAHCASRRSLRDDPNFDALISLLYPDIDKSEAEELAFAEEEKARNKQIQAAIAQTSRRQLEALGKKRATAKATATVFMRRSQSSTRNLRGRRRQKSAEPRDSDNEVDADNDNGGNYSSSTDELDLSTEVRPKRYKRWPGRPSSFPSSSGANGGCDDNEKDGSRKMIGASVGLVGSPEILGWGCGGMRSHTRHGGHSSAGKNARNTQHSKLIHHFKKLPQNDDELNINLKLVSLDEQNIPNLQKLYVCCKPTMSTTHVCQYVAIENGLQADEIELLLVKGNRYDVDPSCYSTVSPDEESEPVVINSVTDELQLLDEHQIMLDIAQLSSRNNLIIAYRKKRHSS